MGQKSTFLDGQKTKGLQNEGWTRILVLLLVNTGREDPSHDLNSTFPDACLCEK